MKIKKNIAIAVVSALVICYTHHMAAAEIEDSDYNKYNDITVATESEQESSVYEDFRFREREDGTLMLDAYIGKGGNVVIPETFKGKLVTKIGSSAFSDCTSLTSVEIPDSVTEMGDGVFSNCASLTSVKISNSMTNIGSYAFYKCTSLTAVEIPNSVTMMGNYSFYNCTSLTSVEVSNSMTNIGNYAFCNCTSLTSVKISSSVTNIGSYAFYNCTSLTSVEIPNSVTEIRQYAFSGCTSLTSIEIPNSVTEIRWYAFSGCTSLTSVKISDSVTSISSDAFLYCPSLTAINVDKNNENYSSNDGVLFNKAKTRLVRYPEGKTDKSYTIPNGVAKIDDDAFIYCDILDLVEIPNSVTEIGNDAFYGCSFTVIEFPNNLISIGERAFKECTLLTSVIMSESVTNIGKNAFYNCSDSLTFYGISGSYAEIYANENNINFNGIKSADSNGDDLGVEVLIPVDAPTNTVFNVKKISETDEDVTYDIFLSAGGKKVNLNGQNAIVKIPLSNEENKFNYKVYRKEVNGKYTDMQAAVLNMYFVFTTDYFGEYIITNVQRCNVARRTEDEIKEYIKNNPFFVNEYPTYDVTPDTSSSIIGSLDSHTLNSSLNALNCMRYIAGLSDVELDEYYCTLTQAGSFVNCINNYLSHYPYKPSTVSDEVYELARIGAGRSNIGSGYRNPAASVIFGYMEDSDDSNIDRVGHRRWCLDPSMGKTGFGQVGRYTAMYALDRSLDYDEYNICWPAQTMPVEYFDSYYAWSLSIGKYLDSDNITVTLTRKSDSKIWRFGANNSDGFFNVDNGNYGLCGCIIFRPDGIADYKDGDSFHVLIEGTKMPISYDVNFFTLVEYELGDVNHDKSINDQDSILLDRYLSEWGNEIYIACADMNGDGKVNDQDSIILARTLAGWYD